jgi:hypothetical protein
MAQDDWEREEALKRLIRFKRQYLKFERKHFLYKRLDLSTLNHAIKNNRTDQIGLEPKSYHCNILEVETEILPPLRTKIIENICHDIVVSKRFLMTSSNILKGSPYDIATKLTRKYLYENYGLTTYTFGFDLTPSLSECDINLETLVEYTEQRLISEHTCYKLWNQKSLSLLKDYLFKDGLNSILYTNPSYFIGSSIITESSPELKKEKEQTTHLTHEDFCAVVDGIINCLPREDFTTKAYPSQKEGVVFSEYLPLKLLNFELTLDIYNEYLSLFSPVGNVEIIT